MIRKTAWVAAIAGLSVAGSVAAWASDKEPAAGAGLPARAEITIDGPMLVTPAGMSLYLDPAENTRSPKFAWQCTDVVQRVTNDSQSGIGERPQIGFKLIKSCLDKFRPYTADPSAAPVGDFSVVKRPDGSGQWAYKSVPLWLSTKDRQPGDRNAAGRGFIGGRGGGLGLASAPISLPAGLKLTRRAEGLVLTATDGRAVYSPRAGGRLMKASTGTGREDFRPIAAPAIAKVSGDWSIVDDGSGQKQYAFKGKPLYTAPVSLNDLEIANVRGWDPVVVVKAPPVPAAIGEHLTLSGSTFTDKKGMTLYQYNCNAGTATGPISVRAAPVTCDDAGDPAAFMVALCGDAKECARRWHPYIAAPGAKPEGEFSIVDITYPMFTDMRGALYPADAPHVKAWAYRGKPLFTYYEDEKPGDMWGNAVGGIWGSTWTLALVPGKAAVGFEP